MALLFSNEILESVKKQLEKATTSVQIITAYCKNTTFLRLNGYIGEGVEKRRLLVRFRMDDILNGSTDFSVLESGLKNGWEVYIRFDLHAKTYIVDNKRGLVGSANVTKSGLGIGQNGNMEMATLVDIELQDIQKVDKLFNDAISVSPELIVKLKNQLDNVHSLKNKERHSWDSSITTMFNPHIETLFSYEFPDETTISEGTYYAFLDETYLGDLEAFKDSVRWSNAYLWLLTTLKENEGCLYFGELTEKLHNAIVSDPKPYRKDVKIMLANLLTMIEKLELNDVIIDRPNYSQRIKLSSDIME